MTQPFLIRLLTGVLVIWLVQVVLDRVLGLKEPANRTVFVLTVIVAVMWILFGWVIK
jgi:hypothetical protein